MSCQRLASPLPVPSAPSADADAAVDAESGTVGVGGKLLMLAAILAVCEMTVMITTTERRMDAHCPC